MKQYLALLNDVIDNGNVRTDRTNTGTISVFGRQLRFDLSKGFPLVTTKKVYLRGIVEELLWMLRGSTNANELAAQDVHIWDAWAVREADRTNFPEVPLGELGPVYGAQWRSWKTSANNSTRYTLPVRFDMAAYLITMNLTEGKFNTEVLDDLRAVYAEAAEKDDHHTKRAVYDQLTNWGVPQASNEDRVIDQIQNLVDGIRGNPFSRRHIVSAWNVGDLPDETRPPQTNAVLGKMALAPCHTLFQFYVRNRRVVDMWEQLDDQGRRDFTAFVDRRGTPRGGLSFDFAYRAKCEEFFRTRGINPLRLDCQLYQRSADLVLGVPFNIASYALLTMMVAQCVGMEAGEFIHTFGDAHIYSNHLEANREGESIFTQLDREPYALPQMVLNPEVKDIFAFKVEDFDLQNYESHPPIKFKVAV